MTLTDTSGNVSTIAGDGTAAHKNGTPLQAQFSNPVRLLFDSAGSLYVLSGGIRKITP